MEGGEIIPSLVRLRLEGASCVQGCSVDVPEACVLPEGRKLRSCSVRSIPSAVASRPSPSARLTIARTIAMLAVVCVMPLTKLRSIIGDKKPTWPMKKM